MVDFYSCRMGITVLVIMLASLMLSSAQSQRGTIVRSPQDGLKDKTNQDSSLGMLEKDSMEEKYMAGRTTNVRLNMSLLSFRFLSFQISSNELLNYSKMELLFNISSLSYDEYRCMVTTSFHMFIGGCSKKPLKIRILGVHFWKHVLRKYQQRRIWA
jgi:hypothetical protein